MYRLVTGFYPSYLSAQKVLQKAKAICKDAFIDNYYEGYCVVLEQDEDKEKLMNLSLFYNLKKLYCGIVYHAEC